MCKLLEWFGAMETLNQEANRIDLNNERRIFFLNPFRQVKRNSLQWAAGTELKFEGMEK